MSQGADRCTGIASECTRLCSALLCSALLCSALLCAAPCLLPGSLVSAAVVRDHWDRARWTRQMQRGGIACCTRLLCSPHRFCGRRGDWRTKRSREHGTGRGTAQRTRRTRRAEARRLRPRGSSPFARRHHANTTIEWRQRGEHKHATHSAGTKQVGTTGAAQLQTGSRDGVQLWRRSFLQSTSQRNCRARI